VDGNLTEGERPEFWEQLWERYVESKLHYKSAEETLQSKRRQAGADCLRLLEWLEPLGAESDFSVQIDPWSFADKRLAQTS
jgi:hypothetical protein